MKRVFILLLSCMLSYVVVAQSKDVVDSAASATGVVDGSMVAIPDEDYDDYVEPDGLRGASRNPIYYFGHDFSTWFAELQLLAGTRDVAGGISVSHVPEVWGGYVSLHEGVSYYWGAFGVEYRLSSPWQKCDWHLYGGYVLGDGVGGEVGIRLAANRYVNYSKFGWISGSMGVRTTTGGTYFTMGLSLGICGFMVLLY